MYVVIYDSAGAIRQRMTGGAVSIAATAHALGMQALAVPDDADYERTHRVEDGKLAALPA